MYIEHVPLKRSWPALAIQLALRLASAVTLALIAAILVLAIVLAYASEPCPEWADGNCIGSVPDGTEAVQQVAAGLAVVAAFSGIRIHSGRRPRDRRSSLGVESKGSRGGESNP